MAKGSKKKYKQFEIQSLEDACLVMIELISNVERNLCKYKEYAAEAKELWIKYEGKDFVPAKEYEDINDKLLFRQHELLKFLSDRQSSSFSYLDFRHFLVKKGYITSELEEKTNEILNEFLDIRNWTFHNAQSLLVASKEAGEKNIPEELKGMVKISPQLNPVFIPKIVSYEFLCLESLVVHCYSRIEKYEIVLECMKNDYDALYKKITNNQIIIGLNEVLYLEKEIQDRFLGMNSDIVQISMAIQKSKYDGSDEAYNKWTLK